MLSYPIKQDDIRICTTIKGEILCNIKLNEQQLQSGWVLRSVFVCAVGPVGVLNHLIQGCHLQWICREMALRGNW